MSDADTFTLLPLQVDPQTKAVTTSSSSKTLQAELNLLNTLHRALLGTETPNNIPPPPVPVNPKRSAQIQKLRDNANAEYRKGKYAEATRLYTLGLQMALSRPLWEPQGLVREEVAGLYANRGKCLMEMGRLDEAREWVRKGLEMESNEAELLALLKDLEERIAKGKGDGDEE